MNLHVPIGTQATAEVAILMRASSRLLTPQRNAPVAGIVQDGLVASYILTNTWENETCTMVRREDFMNCITAADISSLRYQDLLWRAKEYYPDYIKVNGDSCTLKKEFPGKLAFSITLPPNLWFEKKTDTSEKYPVVKINSGVLVSESGPICKKTIGAKGNSIVHILCLEYSPEVAIRFLTEVQFLTDLWLPNHGFSIGISDCQTSGHSKIAESLASMKPAIEKLRAEEPDPDVLESKINSYLNKMGNVGTEIANETMNKGDRNAWNIMRKSGAKGNIVNLSSTIAFVGQQNIKGRRVPKTLSNGTRTLPCFEPNDDSPEARGFVSGNYLGGLSPSETFMHAGGGREGIIATAIGTGQTGYLHKRISRFEEDNVVFWDGTVRNNSTGRIIQFLYGDDGMDPQKLYYSRGVKFPFFINSQSVSKRLNRDAERTREVSAEDFPRELSEEEILLLLSYIKAGAPGIQSDITKNATEIFHRVLRKTLEGVQLYECKIADFCHECREHFETAKAQHGEMVGLISASSIGEPSTQMSLNTFHFSGHGNKDVSLGIPRFTELLNATDSPKKPSCTVYFEDQYLSEMAETTVKLEKQISNAKKGSRKAKKAILKQIKVNALEHVQSLAKIFELKKVQDLFLSSEMFFVPDGYTDISRMISPVNILEYSQYSSPWWVSFIENFSQTPSVSPQSWVVRLKFDVKKMFLYDFTLEQIAFEIERDTEGCVSCIRSPNCMGLIDLYTDFSAIRDFLKKKKKDLVDSDLPDRITDQNLEFFLCRDRLIPYVKDIQLSGISHVSKVFPNEDAETKEWFLETKGTNLVDILSTPGVDPKRTVTDDLIEVYKTFGIEAARKFLIEEITRIISFDGTYVNPRHIQLLVDTMTNTGSILNVTRNGISRHGGPWRKIAFEQPVDNAIQAAAFTEKDTLNGLSASVVYGKQAPIGTGMMEIQPVDQIPAKLPKIPKQLKKKF